MSKKLIGLTLALALFAVALPASAAGLTQTQISAILSLLQSFGAEQSVINNVSVSLGGGTPSNTGSGISCVELSYNLFSGSTDNATGGQVTKLQRFLGVDTTGYFGPATEAAVQRWQAQNGVVSSGSPDSTGYGYVGTKTRAAMARGCNGSTASDVIFGATPTTGIAPLKVQFTSAYYSTHDASETQYYVRFGDETKELGRITCIKSNGADELSSFRCLQWGVSHVYNSGTYTAELIRKVGSKSTTLSTLPIIVSGSNAGDIQVKNFQAAQSGLTAEFSAEVVSGDWEKLIINFGDGASGNMKKTVCPGITCFVGASHTYPRAGVYVAQLASKLKPSQVLGTATVTATTDTVSFLATPTTGVAPLTVAFKISVGSAGGDHFDFGDGTDACSIPGVARDEGGCTAPINTQFSHTYTRPGTYTVRHSRSLPSTTLGTVTITVGQN